MRHVGPLIRAPNPVYAPEPSSGPGTALCGWRFDRRGIAAPCTSPSPLAAIRKAGQVGRLQPGAFVSHDADVVAILDGRDAEALVDIDSTPAAPAADGWREIARRVGTAPRLRLADRLIEADHAGRLVPSPALESRLGDLDLVPRR